MSAYSRYRVTTNGSHRLSCIYMCIYAIIRETFEFAFSCVLPWKHTKISVSRKSVGLLYSVIYNNNHTVILHTYLIQSRLWTSQPNKHRSTPRFCKNDFFREWNFPRWTRFNPFVLLQYSLCVCVVKLLITCGNLHLILMLTCWYVSVGLMEATSGEIVHREKFQFYSN